MGLQNTPTSLSQPPVSSSNNAVLSNRIGNYLLLTSILLFISGLTSLVSLYTTGFNLPDTVDFLIRLIFGATLLVCRHLLAQRKATVLWICGGIVVLNVITGIFQLNVLSIISILVSLFFFAILYRLKLQKWLV